MDYRLWTALGTSLDREIADLRGCGPVRGDQIARRNPRADTHGDCLPDEAAATQDIERHAYSNPIIDPLIND